jgi:DHA3 family macrolide efflux protein-like MFS transporter
LDVENQQARPPKWAARFFAIWTGQALSLIGSSVAQFALVWWVTKLTGSATVLATATMVAVLPGVFLGPIAGAYVDRWSRRLVMIAADAVVALAALALAYLFWSGSMQVWHLYVVMLVRAIGGSFHWPAMQASTTLMVPKEHLSRIAGANQTMYGVMSVAGPPLGALLLAVMPLYGIMLIDVGTAALAIVPLFFIHIPQPQRSASMQGVAADGKKPSIWADVAEGLRYVWNWPGLFLVMIMAMIINFVMAPAGSLIPLLVTKHFNGDALQLGTLESAWGIGVIAGGLFLSAWGGFRRRIYTSLLGVTLMGLGIITIGLAPSTLFWLAVAGNAIAGFMNPITNGPLFAVLQATVAPDYQGRVFTVVNSLASAMMPLSLAVAGPLADSLGMRAWYVMGGVSCVVLGLVAFFIPAIVNLEQNHSGHRAEGQVPVPATVEVVATDADAL